MSDPVLSIVTGKLNRHDSFLRLVTSICNHTDVSWELVVSDASEEDFPHSLPVNVRMLPERPRLGCVKGYNRAFRAALGEWVIWLNDDAEVLPGYASNAIAFMESNPGVGLGALYYSEDNGPFRINFCYDMIYANFGIIRRNFGDSIDWFDEDLIMYGNDNSISFKALLAGFGIVGIPNSRVIHHSEKDQSRIENQRNRMTDSARLLRKYTAPDQIVKMKRAYYRTAHLIGPSEIKL